MKLDSIRKLKPTGLLEGDESKAVTEIYDVIIPCEIHISPTRKFKDGTYQWLVFGNFKYGTSQEKPSLCSVRAKTLKAAKEKVQAIINEQLSDFIKERNEAEDN